MQIQIRDTRYNMQYAVADTFLVRLQPFLRLQEVRRQPVYSYIAKIWAGICCLQVGKGVKRC